MTTHIQLIEELAANAWAPAIVQVAQGWRLRFNWGVTQRANSVLTNDWRAEHDLSAMLDLAEDFYARRGQHALFQMCPASLPAGLDEVLAQRGYARISDTDVQNAATREVIARTAARADAAQTNVGDLTDAWMDAYAVGAQMQSHERAMRYGIVQRIAPRAGFALARMAGEAAAVGLAVAERGWCGIFCMETMPNARRRGAATSILHGLAQWALAQGAESMYLQVLSSNAPAQALYARAGFMHDYTYHYRRK
jgi:ribosomal protein S18 acetylase RimI-like enzyme